MEISGVSNTKYCHLYYKMGNIILERMIFMDFQISNGNCFIFDDNNFIIIFLDLQLHDPFVKTALQISPFLTVKVK